jgi:hypothetical protein
MQHSGRRVFRQFGLMIVLAFTVSPAGRSQARQALNPEPRPQTSPPILQLRSGDYAGPVRFTASGLPPGATAALSPATIPVNGGAQTVTVRIAR